MEYYVAIHWRYVTAVLQMLFGASLLLMCHAGKCSAFGFFLHSFKSYFYSFSPILLLFYILYKLSYVA